MNRKSIYIGCIPGATNEEKFANAAKAGFAAIEPSGVATDEERAALKALYEKYNIVCPSVMTAGNWQFPASSPDAEAREKAAQCFRNAILTAKYLGADTILAVPGKVDPSMCYEDSWKYSRMTIEAVIPFAKENGVIIAIENVWNKFLLSPREMCEYIDSFDSEWVKAYFDVGNILLYGYPQHWIKSLGKRIQKVHIKGFKREGNQLNWVSLLKSESDWKAVMDAFKEVGYEGYLTAELSVDERGLEGMAEDIDALCAM